MIFTTTFVYSTVYDKARHNVVKKVVYQCCNTPKKVVLGEGCFEIITAPRLVHIDTFNQRELKDTFKQKILMA